MTHHWDEFSKSLAEKSGPRRESLRLLGVAVAGALLGPLGVRTAWAGPDPCRAFCNRYPKAQRASCLAACQTCRGDTSRLCASGPTLSCCATGTTCCSGYCTDLADDFDNCGACGAPCDYPGRYEDGACVDGHCFYWCVEGAADCDGACTDLWNDPGNCGACGNACPPSAHVCDQGVCVCPSGNAVCDGECIDIQYDPDNCGACGNVCPSSAPYCRSGACFDRQCPPGLTWCQLMCVDLLFNNYNCGACNKQCPSGTVCSFGTCVGSCEGC